MASITSLPGIEKPPSYMTLSLLSFMFCNFLTGSLAMYLSYSSDKWYRYGHVERARNRGNLAKLLSILTFLLGVAAYIGFAICLYKYPIPAFTKPTIPPYTDMNAMKSACTNISQ